MGKKHAKKRFFCVKYQMKPDKKFDELITLTKKKIGSGKMLQYSVVLDLINKEVIKCDLPGTENLPYEQIEQHYRKWYADAMEQFVK